MSTETNRLLDRLLMLLGPLGAVTVALWYVGVYKGQTDARLAGHDVAIASVSAIAAADHDIVSKMSVQVSDLHDWLKAKTQDSQDKGK